MNIIIRVSKFLFAAIIALILFELFFQGSEVILPPMVIDDSTFGRKFNPHSRITMINESFNMTEVNDLGYIGRAYPIKKEDNDFRIALIGDSFVEGLQVKDELHFGAVLEKDLNRISHSEKFQVLNFGRSGLDFRKMYIYYELLAKNYNPDLVLIFVEESDFIGNDYNLGPQLLINSNDSLYVDFDFRNSGEFRNKVKFNLLRKFSMYSLFKSAYANYKNDQTARILFDKFYFKKESLDEVTRSSFELDPYHDLNNLVLMSYAKIQAETKIKFVIITIETLSASTTSSIINNNIRIISLHNVYRKMEEMRINPFYWKATNMYGHWNQEAHKQIGKYLAKKILEYL